MKFVGFIKEEDKNIQGAKPFFEMFNGMDLDENSRKRIIEYLTNGHVISATMTFVRDLKDGEGIGGLTYHSDGKFIWPIYYVFYLSKYSNFKLDKDFVDYAKSQDYVMKNIGKQELMEIENFFEQSWAVKETKAKPKLKSKIRPIIKKKR
ncbi:hypothetical protein GCM10009122_14220 [Fulvivirga kasyanovii]|uniref:hypothetical protein n=1 Tax=Fulvivirga kasyanovii TaxID=396812 RepID=UPI0031E0ABBB